VKYAAREPQMRLACTLHLLGRPTRRENLVRELVPCVRSGPCAAGVDSTHELVELGGVFNGLEDGIGVDEQLERIRH